MILFRLSLEFYCNRDCDWTRINAIPHDSFKVRLNIHISRNVGVDASTHDSAGR